MKPEPGRAFGGIWRLTLGRFLAPGHARALLVMLALLGLVFGLFLQARNGPRQFLGFTVVFYFTFLVPLMAFLSGSGAVREALKPGAVNYLFTRPVRRPMFLAFKYAAHAICLEVEFLLPLAVLLAAAAAWHVPGAAAAVPILLLAQTLAVAAFSAFGFLCAILSGRFYLVIGLVYGGVIEVGVGNIPMSVNRLSLLHQIRMMLNPAVRAAAGVGWHPAIVAALAILAGFSAAAVAVAALVFGRQELVTGSRSDV